MTEGPKKTHERMLAAMAVVVIAGAILGVWVIEPLIGKIGQARSEIEGKKTKLESVKRLIGESTRVNQEYQALAEFYEDQTGGVAPHAILDEIETLSSQLNLQLNLKPRGLKHDEDMEYFEIELEVQGSQDPMMSFLDELLRLRTLMLVERLRVTNAPTREHKLQANILLRQVKLEK